MTDGTLAGTSVAVTDAVETIVRPALITTKEIGTRFAANRHALWASEARATINTIARKRFTTVNAIQIASVHAISAPKARFATGAKHTLKEMK